MRWMTTIGWVGAMAVVGTAAPAVAAECTDCHDKVDPAKVEKSAHGKLGKGTESCRKCHGDFAVTDDGHEKPPAVECAKCHKEPSEKWMRGIHKSVEGGPDCAKCHGTHEVAALQGDTATHRDRVLGMCGQCHESDVKNYLTSRHGQSKAKKPATCEDCHGAHDIRSAKDPESSVYRLNQAGTCAACHANTDDTDFTPDQVTKVKNYFSTVHGIAVTKGGLIVSATCVDCHGNHTVGEVNKPDAPVARAKVPETCGKCHPGVLKSYMESVHGKPLRDGNTDVPVCTDCHSSHEIQSHLAPGATTYGTNVAKTCLKCHADANFLNKYSLPGQRVETYLESYHGAATKLGDTRVANCASCHGSHDIRKSDDPRSSTNAANMTRTCGQCHKVDDPSRPLIRGKIHQSLAEENHWITGLVRNLYILLVTATIGFFLLYILMDLIRIARSRRKA